MSPAAPDPSAALRPAASLAAGESALRHALHARLLGSPQEWDAATRVEVAELGDWARTALADDATLAGLLAELPEPEDEAAAAEWARRYSALFEVGSHGAPLPVREELTASAGGGSKEEVVRFYDLFGYELAPAYAWAPDHLAPMLEFLGWLAGLESGATDDEERASLRRAQRDFIERHLWHWLPALALAVRSRDGAGPYVQVLDCLEASVRAERLRLADEPEVA
jgi:DMSO reductase family type II enzyme chaperone